MMKKKGFTLIELMVVIVIAGVLSAVGIPKLFGLVAKSKASELGLAASTYVKLQDGFASETGALGAWKAIGYIAPGSATEDGNGNVLRSISNSFTYTGGSTESLTTCTSGTWNGSACVTDGNASAGQVIGSTITRGWVASNNRQLNGCVPGDHWNISASIGHSTSSPGSVEYTKPALNAECLILTPNFDIIGK